LPRHQRPVRSFIVQHSALIVFCLALCLYGLTALLGGNFHHQEYAYFNQLADAFLHGNLHLSNPDGTHDLVLFDGRWYVPFPPGPALLLLPWIAAVGVSFDEVALSVVIGAANVTLMFCLLRSLARQGHSRLDTSGAAWLTALFAAGTVHWVSAATGTVSFLAHVCAVTGLTVALWQASERRPWAAGLGMAWAIACRPTVGLAMPAVLALLLAPPAYRIEAPQTRRPWQQAILALGVPLTLAGALLLAYNQARFGSPWQFGYDWVQTQTPFLAERLAIWGAFHPHYLAENLRVMLIGLPKVGWRLPPVWPDPNGLSVLLVTPAFLWLVTSWKRQWVAAGVWLSVALVAIPLLLYYNTGWVQFGYRFSLDYLPLLFVLLAVGLRRITSLLKAAIAAAWLINLWGVVWWFARFY
jgi:hypothetical protein